MIKPIRNPFNAPVYRLESCTSTNEVAADHAEKNAVHGTVIISKKQTKGKGRHGRTWITSSNSLAISIILRPNIDHAIISRFTLATAVALLEALNQFGIKAYIKWPNDIVILSKDGKEIPGLGPFRKVAGILTEAYCSPGEIPTIIIGIGINVSPNNTAVELSEFPQAGFLVNSDVKIIKENFCQALLNSLYQHCEKIDSSSHWNSCLQVARLNSATLNRKIIFTKNETEVTGLAVDINDDGSLLIKLENGQLHLLYAGEASLK